MQTIGLIGGVSWQSTEIYYRVINETVAAELGGSHSAKMLISSLDFAEISEMCLAEDWVRVERRLAEEGRRLARAGADFLVLGANTLHLVADAVREASGLPLLHIGEPAGAAVRASKVSKVGLLGTRFTMGADLFGSAPGWPDVEIAVPGDADREVVHRIIYDELVLGRFTEASREAYRGVIARLVEAGAEGVVLACTEIPLLLGAADSPVPLFDTTRLHAAAAARRALSPRRRKR